MKNALILALGVIIALLALSHEYGVQPVIEDTSFHKSDWTDCTQVRGGPITSRKPKYHPYERKPDSA